MHLGSPNSDDKKKLKKKYGKLVRTTYLCSMNDNKNTNFKTFRGRPVQSYRINNRFISFVEQLRTSHDIGANKRILDILMDDDLESINEQLTYRQTKQLHNLDNIVLELVEFLNQNLEDQINNGLSKMTLYELISLIDAKLLQIMKLRITIKPEIIANITVHSVTKHKYIVLRALWLDSNFKKTRKFSISIGNIEKYGNKNKINPKDFGVEYNELVTKIQTLYNSEYQ